MYEKWVKRILDIVISMVLLLPFIIISLPIALLIKFDDKGPVFYCGHRLGKDMKVFPMIKFRTMKPNAPDLRNEDGSTYNASDDPRLTKIGKQLRKTSLDELPQILNVLKGDMSLIGPRPSPLGNQDKYSKAYLRKFDVKPGITGYNQVVLRNNAIQEQREKNDLFYVKNISLWLDVKIMVWTFFVVVRAKNINRNEPE